MNILETVKRLVLSSPTPEYSFGIHISVPEGETVKQVLDRVITFQPPAKYPVIDMKIVMPCGDGTTYPTINDIPETDTPCTCGNPKHFFVKISRTP